MCKERFYQRQIKNRGEKMTKIDSEDTFSNKHKKLLPFFNFFF